MSGSQQQNPMPANQVGVEKIMPLKVPPGIRRDGAYIEGDLMCVDGQWVRFDRDAPRKMAGYQRLTNQLPNLTRGMYIDDFEGSTNVYLGQPHGIGEVLYYNTGSVSAYFDRTPATFTGDDDVLWQIDQIFDAASSKSLVLAHPGRNLNDINSRTVATVWGGPGGDQSKFTAVGGGTTPPPNVDGGIVVAEPYVFYFGSDGYITWSAPNEPGEVDTTKGGGGTAGARIAKSKLVRGLVFRGGVGASPSALFWTTNSLELATFSGGSTVFSFQNVSDSISLLSTRCPLEYDGRYFWWGTDRFFMYLGFVQEVPNKTNLDWFFDNLNMTQRQKVFSFKVPRRGEIWTCFPFGDATECTHAIIYNVRNGSWYDTILPNGGRCDGYYGQNLKQPILAGLQEELNTYKLWAHELGLNEVDGNEVRAILSYFLTGNLSISGSTGRNLNAYLGQIEPDFVQQGNLVYQTRGKINGRGPDIAGDRLVFGPDEELIHPKDSRRFLQLYFESNVADGYYLMGTPYLHLRAMGGRST